MRNNSENSLLEDLGTNLNKLLYQKGWSQVKFAELLRTADTEFTPSQPDISHYLCGTVEMGFYEFLCICQVLEIHSSVLLPVTNQPQSKYMTITCPKTRDPFRQEFGKQLTDLINSETGNSMKTNEKTKHFITNYTDAGYELGFSDDRSALAESTFYRYRKGLRNPPLLNAVILCHLFKKELSDFFLG